VSTTLATIIAGLVVTGDQLSRVSLIGEKLISGVMESMKI
jgi:hypothetical protein